MPELSDNTKDEGEIYFCLYVLCFSSLVVDLKQPWIRIRNHIFISFVFHCRQDLSSIVLFETARMVTYPVRLTPPWTHYWTASAYLAPRGFSAPTMGARMRM